MVIKMSKFDFCSFLDKGMVGVMLELKETKKADIELYWDILDMLNVPLEITNDFKKIEGFLSKINLKYVQEVIKQCKNLQD